MASRVLSNNNNLTKIVKANKEEKVMQKETSNVTVAIKQKAEEPSKITKFSKEDRVAAYKSAGRTTLDFRPYVAETAKITELKFTEPYIDENGFHPSHVCIKCSSMDRKYSGDFKPIHIYFGSVTPDGRLDYTDKGTTWAIAFAKSQLGLFSNEFIEDFFEDEKKFVGKKIRFIAEPYTAKSGYRGFNILLVPDSRPWIEAIETASAADCMGKGVK